MGGKVACFSSPRLLHILFANKRQRAVLRLVDLPAAGRRPLLVLVQPLLLILLLLKINPRLKNKLLNQHPGHNLPRDGEPLASPSCLLN